MRCSISHNNLEWGLNVLHEGSECDVSDSRLIGNGKGAIEKYEGGKVKSSNNTIE